MKITYIDHSGFCVECENVVFIFDYYKGELPEFDRKKKQKEINALIKK